MDPPEAGAQEHGVETTSAPTHKHRLAAAVTESESRATPQPDQADTCADKDGRCAEWALQGKCSANTDFMIRICCSSCFLELFAS